MAPPKSIIRNRVKSKDKNGNNGKGTFNKTSKQNKYDMKDIHFQATRVSNEEGGGAGCMGSNCAKACCMFSIDIVGIGKDDYVNKKINDILFEGNRIYFDSPLLPKNLLGKIVDYRFPNACCQDLLNVLDCPDSETIKRKCPEETIIKRKTWPLTINLTIRPESCTAEFISKAKAFIIPGSSTGAINFKATGGWDNDAPQIVQDEMYTPGTSRRGAINRNPIRGYRKVLVNDDCCLDDDFEKKKPNLKKTAATNDIYQDMHSKYAKNTINPKTGEAYGKGICYSSIIRSGLQSKPKTCCNTGNTAPNCAEGKCITKNSYSHSYREYLHNKRCKSFDRSLEKFFNHKEDIDATMGSCPTGSCQISEYSKGSCCNCSKTIYKPNNRKYGVQGAVSSSSRLDRLKLDTIRVSNSKCAKGKRCKTITTKYKNKTKEYKVPNGPYSGGKPRYGPLQWKTIGNKASCTWNPRQQTLGIPQHQSKRMGGQVLSLFPRSNRC